MSSDELNMLGYFYSTVAQSIAAIIALFGLFATFRIQYSNIEKEAALKSLREYIVLKCRDINGVAMQRGYQYVDNDVKCWLDKDVPSHLREIVLRGDLVQKDKLGGFFDFYLFINTIEDFTRYLTRSLMLNMINLAIFLVFNILALFYSKDLLCLQDFFNNPVVKWLDLVWLGVVLFCVIRYTAISIKGPNFININNNQTNNANSGQYAIPVIEEIMKTHMRGKGVSESIVRKFKGWI
jgi:fumarate reductase subunit C